MTEISSNLYNIINEIMIWELLKKENGDKDSNLLLKIIWKHNLLHVT